MSELNKQSNPNYVKTMNKLKLELKGVKDRIDADAHSTSKEKLRQLSMSRDVEVRRRVAANYLTPIDTLKILATDSDALVRARTALNPSTSNKISLKIAKNSNFDTQVCLSNEFDLHEEILLVLAKHKNPFVRDQANRSLNEIELERQLDLIQFRTIRESDYLLGEILRATNLVKESVLMQLLDVSKTWGLKYGHVLVRTKTLNVATITSALQAQMLLRLGGTKWDDAISIIVPKSKKFYTSEARIVNRIIGNADVINWFSKNTPTYEKHVPEQYKPSLKELETLGIVSRRNAKELVFQKERFRKLLERHARTANTTARTDLENLFDHKIWSFNIRAV